MAADADAAVVIADADAAVVAADADAAVVIADAHTAVVAADADAAVVIADAHTAVVAADADAAVVAADAHTAAIAGMTVGAHAVFMKRPVDRQTSDVTALSGGCESGHDVPPMVKTARRTPMIKYARPRQVKNYDPDQAGTSRQVAARCDLLVRLHSVRRARLKVLERVMLNTVIW